MEPRPAQRAFRSMDTRPDANPADDPRQRFRVEAWPQLPALLRVARVLTGDAHKAEDLVQETMMRALSHIASYQPGTNIRAWLLTILRRTHIDVHRRDQRRVAPVSLDAAGVEPGADDRATDPAADEPWLAIDDPDRLLARFEDEPIAAAMRALPEPMRWTLLLVDVERLSVAEAGEALGVAPGTVKSRASRARALLREALLPEARRRGYLADEAGSEPTR